MTRFFIDGKQIAEDKLENVEIQSEEIKRLFSKYLTTRGGSDVALLLFGRLQSLFGRPLSRLKIPLEPLILWGF